MGFMAARVGGRIVARPLVLGAWCVCAFWFCTASAMWCAVCVVLVVCCRSRGVAFFRMCGCEKREEGACLVGSLLSLLLFCGANDGTRTRCLHLGRVMLRLLSFIRSVFPGCSLLACLRFRGFGADDGA